MNLVRRAMRRPLTVVVAVLAVALGAVAALHQMTRDIFPPLGIPTIYLAQPYGGMDPAQVEGYLTFYYESQFFYITAIEHIESRSIQGAALLKLEFHPGTDMAQALAETVNYGARARAYMPPGTVPPFIMRFDAGSVPVGDLVFSSPTRSVGEMQDLAMNRARPLLATLPGVSAPPPFGGSARSIVVNLNPERLRAYHLSPDEVVTAISTANVISPSGNVAIGDRYPMVPMNAVVRNIKDLEQVPVRPGVYPAVFLRDVATVEDASDVVTCSALVNGRPTVYIPVTKRADASTLRVANLVKRSLPRLQSFLPDDVKVSYEFDQSPYVTRAIDGLLEEGALGAVLAGLMVLLFLRDWRSAGIVVVNIPLSLMGAVVALWVTGQNLNLMTLGGMALAVGILVDQATVTVENLHTHLFRGKGLARAALEATAETSLPQLLAMLCIVAVFLPTFFMVGAARALFVPLALAVGFSMIASFVLSTTLVPILSVWVLRGHSALSASSLFERCRAVYARRLGSWMRWRGALVAAYLVVCGLVIVGIGRRLGVEIFPRVDAGQLQVRLRAPTGTRLERTEALTLAILEAIKREVGANNVRLSLAFIGVHSSSYPVNLIYLWNSGPEEAVVQVQFERGATLPMAQLQERLRARFAAELRDVRFSFEPGDLVSRVMSLGAPTPIEIAISGPSLAANRRYAEHIRERLAQLPALRDLQFGQALDYPTVDVALDRERAGLMGIKVQDATRAFVAATASSRFTTPVFWADPESGVSYRVQVQVPKTRLTSLEEIRNIPVANVGGNAVLLRSVARVAPGTAVGHYERYNMQRSLTLTANIAGTDLGSAIRQVAQALGELSAPPRGASVALRGQVATLEQMLGGLRAGLFLAVVVVFLMLAANFQSLRLSLAVVSTVPATIAGVALALALTGTTLNVESFMGAIMAVGVAVANAILLVTFAERSRVSGAAAQAAAVEGARSRLRPILMTSLAMIAGMLPIALGLGEGAEQAASLGRAVVGGLMAATLATLVVLPSVFALLQTRSPIRSASLDPDDPDGACYEARSGGAPRERDSACN